MVTRTHVVLALLFAGGCSRAPHAPPKKADLRIEEHTVTYAGTRLSLGSPLGEWKRAFGEPSRFVDRDGGIHIWDDLGLAVSLRTRFPASDPHVAALRIFFAARDVDFWPHHVYAGAVTFVQKSDEAGQPDVVATLDAKTGAPELQKQHVSTRYGYPYLSNFVEVRFVPSPSNDRGLELCSVRVDPTVVRLPWEGAGP
jgi:hypothetical protein